MKGAVILIAEGDGRLCQNLKERLFQHGYKISKACDKNDVLRILKFSKPALIVLGSSPNGDWDGLELAEQIRREDRNLPLILINPYSCEERAISALRVGINDYFKTPISYEEVVASISRLLADFRRTSSVNIPVHSNDQPIIGDSLSIQEVKAYLMKVAATDCNVLISGETGTGKELIAKLIHQHSPRQEKPMVCINCAALPDGLLESELFGYEKGAFTGAHGSYEGKLKSAQGGTVLMDEIGEMSSYAQAKILRAIESKVIYRLGGKQSIPLDVRFIAATNQALEQLVSENRFRKDLYFRLAIASIHLPPLRERKEDIPLLINHYIEQLNSQYGRTVEGFSEEISKHLFRYDWPGNVRELKNLLEAIFINPPSRRISVMDLPEPFRIRFKDEKGNSLAERELLLSALLSTNWNKSRAAQELHWSRMTLYRKMAKYHIDKENPKP